MTPDDPRVLAAVPRAKRLAEHVARIRPILDPDDATGIAYLELVLCARRYDPTRGAQFWTFAAHRVRGRLLDEAALLERDYRRRAALDDSHAARPSSHEAVAHIRDVLRILPAVHARRAYSVALGLITGADLARQENVTHGAVTQSLNIAASHLRDAA